MTRHGVSGKELQRALGVTYKTAYRMGMQIRKLMAKADGFEMLKGHIESDETYIGGPRPRALRRCRIKPLCRALSSAVVACMLRQSRTPRPTRCATSVLRNVERGSRVSTDEHKGYTLLKRDGYQHDFVNHTRHEYVRGDIHTNSIESFWRLFKNSIRSTHIHVSGEYMNVYLREFISARTTVRWRTRCSIF